MTDTRRRLYITSPIKGGLPHQYHQSFLYLAARGMPGWRFEIACEGNQNALNLSRNVIADMVIKSDAKDDDLVVMMDTDHKWDLEMIKRGLSFDYSKYHIISGTYCKKESGQPKWLGIVKKGVEKPLENGLIEAEFLPTGWLWMTVGVLRKMAKDNPEREFVFNEGKGEILMTELFPIGVAGPRTAEARLRRVKEALKAYFSSSDSYRGRTLVDKIGDACYDEQPPGRCLGEDYFFSFLASRSGFSMWIDTQTVVPHIGPCEFPITEDMVASNVAIPQSNEQTDKW